MTTSTRTIDGQSVPAAGTWNLDPTHSEIGFVARHLVVAKVRGTFTGFSGTITVAEDPSASQVEVSIDAASISTGVADRDGHLMSADFLDAENHPTITFSSTAVHPAGSSWAIEGELTIGEETRPVTLDVEFLGTMTDPWGNDKAIFSASTEIDRTDWNLTWNAPLEAGGVLVGDKVRIAIEAQAAPAG